MKEKKKVVYLLSACALREERSKSRNFRKRTHSSQNLLREERSTLRKGASGESIKSLLIRYELRALRHSGMLITSLYDSGTVVA